MVPRWLRSGRALLVAGGLALGAVGGVVVGRGLPHPPASPPQTAAQAAVPSFGLLSVSSDPWGQLYIDGVRKGHTPATELPIGPGPHTIRVFQDGYAPYEQTITVQAGGDLKLADIRLKKLVTP